ncbi:MAG: LLM class oxidoreductase [Pseudomonadota bacterium]
MSALQAAAEPLAFDTINRGYNATFRSGAMTVGLVVPLEAYPTSAVPTLTDHLERVQLAEALGFAAVWLRDVPFNVPSFGDAGQGFDPFTYLGYLAAHTRDIALGVASAILPLRHPAHLAKAAATADVLSGGRLILGVASGDRPEEYPALGVPFDARGARFREAYAYLRAVGGRNQSLSNAYGSVTAELDLLPKPVGKRLPILITGSSQQAPDWIAQHGDGWMTYPRSPASQAALIDDYRGRTAAADQPPKPVMEPLYIDLDRHVDAPLRPIHLGVHAGLNGLKALLESRRAIGVNHVALNLRFNRAPIDDTLQTLASELLPAFHTPD